MKGEATTPTKYGHPWSHDELILAFELYCCIPFQKTKANNPEVKKLACLLDRSPAGVARKLGNFGAFDPELQKQNISGLSHGSRLDKEVWDEFHHDWNGLVFEAWKRRQMLLRMKRLEPELPEDITIPAGASEREALVKVRVHQGFFRQTILSSYEETCCITGLTVPECLVASHIVSWSQSEEYRTDPSNGLCLSATFDRAFDRGLITISSDYRLMIASRLLQDKNPYTQSLICHYQNKPIIKPKRFLPSQDHLEWHRSNVFSG